MRAVVTDVALDISVRMSMFSAAVSHAKTAESIELPFGVEDLCGLKNRV